MKFVLPFVVTSSLVISGCASMIDDPVFHAQQRDFETVDLNDELTAYRMGHLGQALLEPNTRIMVVEKLTEKAVEIQKSQSAIGVAADLGIGTQMVTDLFVGQFDSSLGSSLGSTVAVVSLAASLFMGDGSLDKASGIYLPQEWDGQSLDTLEKAQAAANSLVKQQIEFAAGVLGYKVQCIENCSERVRVYHLVRQPQADTSSFIYAPDEFALYVNIYELEQVEKTQLVDSMATGFKVTWRTPYGHTAALVPVSSPQKDESGNLKIAFEKEGDPLSLTVYGDLRLAETDFGEHFYRLFHSTPYTVHGTSDEYPKVLFHNGVVYRYVLNSQPNTFDEVLVDNLNLLDASLSTPSNGAQSK